MPTLISGSTGVNKITDGTIVNADIASGAAIAGSKLVMPTGSVLQVVQGTYATSLNTTSTSFIDLGLNADITPSATSSKIWIMYDLHYAILATNRGCGSSLRRDTTALTEGQGHEIYTIGATTNRGRSTYHYLDSPSSTSSINYNVQVKVFAGDVRFNNDDHPIHITLMEIAG
jgi:hypothetical protein